MSYADFALYYDLLTGNVDYRSRAVYFDGIIREFGGENDSGTNILLDLACGTGSLSIEMSRLGYDVIGVDISEQMLSAAFEKKFESGEDVQFLCQDMRNIDMFGTIDVTICALDSINHLESAEDVKKTFEKVSLFTNKGGLFIFDVNTLHKQRDILADNVFVYDTDEVYCVWQNEYIEEEARTAITLDMFEADGDSYYRVTEEFSERVYSTELLDRLLTDAGFEVLAHFADDSREAPDGNAERIIFTARKVK